LKKLRSNDKLKKIWERKMAKKVWGCLWTEQKLDAFEKYVKAYLTMKK